MSFKKTLLFALVLAALGGYFYLYEFKGAKERARLEDEGKRLLHLDQNTVQEIALQFREEQIVAQKGKQGWQLVIPRRLPADQEAINKLLSTLLAAKSDKVVEGSAGQLADFGLHPPAIRVILKTKETAKETVLLIGDLNPQKSHVYAKQATGTKIYLASANLRTELGKNLYDLRDKRPLSVPPAAIGRIDFQFRGEVASIKVNPADRSSWRLVNTQLAGEADGDKIQSLLNTLSGTRIKEFIDEPTSKLSLYGLDNPFPRLQFFDTKDRPLASLAFGKTDPAKQVIYARQGNSPAVLVLEAEDLKDHPREVKELRNRRIISFEHDRAKKVRLTSAGTRMLLSRSDKDSSWYLEQPVRSKAEDSEVNGFLWIVKKLEAKDIIDDTPADLNAYGFQRPWTHLEVWEQEGSKTIRKGVVIGNEHPKRTGRFARVEGSNTILLVDAKVLGELSKTVMDFRDKRLLDFNNDEIKRIQFQYAKRTILLARKGKRWQMLEPEQAVVTDMRMRELLWGLHDLKFQQIASEQIRSEVEKYGFDRPALRITLWKNGDKLYDALIIGKQVPDGPTKGVYARTLLRQEVYVIEDIYLLQLPKRAEDIL